MQGYSRALHNIIERIKTMKSEAKVAMERSLIEAFYQMASESLDPYRFHELTGCIHDLHVARKLGEFKAFPRESQL